MRFFNLDLHIGVIGDIAHIFRTFGHEVTNWSISGHTWVLGRKPDKVDVVNQHTWLGIDRQMCDAFYERYKTELDGYDAFIVTHTPCFAMLYERWNKPILCVASTRYEHPFSNDRKTWESFNDFLRRKIDEGILIPLANNQYDADYAEYFTQRSWRTIPSICEYTNAPYTGKRPESLYYSTKYKGLPPIDGLLNKEAFSRRSLTARALRKLGLRSGGYSWKDLAAFQSIVYVPYNASIMSIFEMYTAGIPMLFPSFRFAMELYPANKLSGVFSELTYNQVRGLPSGSILPSDGLDPNNYEDVEIMAHWIAKSDFYNPDNLNGIVYFDSFEELGEKLHTFDAGEVHRTMMSHNRVRKETIYSAWQDVLANLALRLGK